MGLRSFAIHEHLRRLQAYNGADWINGLMVVLFSCRQINCKLQISWMTVFRIFFFWPTQVSPGNKSEHLKFSFCRPDEEFSRTASWYKCKTPGGWCTNAPVSPSQECNVYRSCWMSQPDSIFISARDYDLIIKIIEKSYTVWKTH